MLTINFTVLVLVLVRVPAESPWPGTVHMPHNASVYINCTLESLDLPFWAINVADFPTTDLQFSEANKEQLNSRGLYELPVIRTPGMPPILRLLINDTGANNNTVIKCSRLSVGVRQTTLYLYGVYACCKSCIYECLNYVYHPIETSALILQAEDLDEEQSLNISWIDPHEANRTYNLTVINSANQQWMLTLQKPYHIFSTPEGVPPCEVYNFSVTATYTGAAYIGDDCLESSNVLDATLPSLPQIKSSPSFHNLSLAKGVGEVALTVYFEVNALIWLSFDSYQWNLTCVHWL